MGDPFALGGVVGDGKRFEDSDRLLNKIEHYEDFDGWSRRSLCFLRHAAHSPLQLAPLRPWRGSVRAQVQLHRAPHRPHRSCRQGAGVVKHELEEGGGEAQERGAAVRARPRPRRRHPREALHRLLPQRHLGGRQEHPREVSGKDGYDETARLSVEMTLLFATRRDESVRRRPSSRRRGRSRHPRGRQKIRRHVRDASRRLPRGLLEGHGTRRVGASDGRRRPKSRARGRASQLSARERPVK